MSTHKPLSATIHKAQPQDAEILAYLSHQLAAYEEMNCKADRQSFIRLIEQSSDAPQCELFVAKHEEKVIAFMLIYPGYDLSTDAYGFHLADICVEEPYRGQGVGKQMMQFLALHTLRMGREWLSLTALEQNEGAVGFYESLHMVNMPIRFLAAGRNILSSMGA